MLNEPSILASGRPPGPPSDKYEQDAHSPQHDAFEAAVMAVMDILAVEHQPKPPVEIAFTGQLLVESQSAYQHLDGAFAELNCHAVLTTDNENHHVVLALKGRVEPRPRAIWPNVVLALLTMLSLLFVGAVHEAGLRDSEDIDLWRGVPYAVSMLLILGAHEFGHYFAARRHGIQVSLPYFLPMPEFIGTLGAFIQIRAPMSNRKVLFDIGIAGPLAGLMVSVPILLIGLATSNVELLPTDTDYMIEGNSLVYAGAKYVIFGQWLPDGEKDVFINQLAKAGWTGLFLTGVNLVPLGQLDGGHILFSLFGKQTRVLYWPVLLLFLILSFFNPLWLLWTLLMFLMGRIYAVPLNTVTELDKRRRWLGYGAIALFLLLFVPNPFTIVLVG